MSEAQKDSLLKDVKHAVERIRMLQAENAALKQKLITAGFHKADKETHINESAQFVKEAAEKIASNAEIKSAKDAEIAGLKRALDAAKVQRDTAIHVIWNGYFSLQKCTEAEYIEGLRKDVNDCNKEIELILGGAK